jgi:hypothetical protein
MKRWAPALLILALGACAVNPQRLPVGISICNAVAVPHGFDIVATVENKSDRPISSLDLSTTFYQNFRYQRLTSSAQLRAELDPGQKRDITFLGAQTAAAQPRGQAIRCFITHIRYLDGTTADAPVSQ